MIDTMKVSNNKVYLYFVADRNYPNLYSIDGREVRSKCKIGSNGKIYCYYVPLTMLTNEGELPEEIQKCREKEYIKFKKYQEKNKKNKNEITN